MDWTAWVLLLISAAVGALTHLQKPAKVLTPVRTALTLASAFLALLALVFASVGNQLGTAGSIPVPLIVVGTTIFAICVGSPYTEFIFHLAAHQRSVSTREINEASPLRGGLWIGLLERTAIVATLWAGWPEGIAIVLAIKGLGRFSELKNHNAAEQFILGTFASSLCACAAFGLGLLLVG